MAVPEVATRRLTKDYKKIIKTTVVFKGHVRCPNCNQMVNGAIPQCANHDLIKVGTPNVSIKDHTEPVPFLKAAPKPENILEWHYLIFGAPDTPYAGGIYHGKLVFPADFPFKPPSIYMFTPSGRFHTNTRLCLSISDFHPDTWNPSWTVSTILNGLLSFMNDTIPTLGSMTSSDSEKVAFAKRSKAYNMKNKTFRELFPEVAEQIRGELSVRSLEAIASEKECQKDPKPKRDGCTLM